MAEGWCVPRRRGNRGSFTPLAPFRIAERGPWCAPRQDDRSVFCQELLGRDSGACWRHPQGAESIPQGLKPRVLLGRNGTAKAVPFPKHCWSRTRWGCRASRPGNLSWLRCAQRATRAGAEAPVFRGAGTARLKPCPFQADSNWPLLILRCRLKLAAPDPAMQTQTGRS
jgi:hypothetical protein